MKVETTALSIKHIAEMYCVNGKHFAELYRNRLSGYTDWWEYEISNGFYFNAANIGAYMSLDETCLSNGETMRQILARSKHTLMMARNKWTDIQRHRVNILFKHYPIIKDAYEFAMDLRSIFNQKTTPAKAMSRMNIRYEKVRLLGNPNFRSVIKTFKNLAPTILNYFRRRATNASAESFNSKVKIFRSQMRGVSIN